jgi:hypothetical protein
MADPAPENQYAIPAGFELSRANLNALTGSIGERLDAAETRIQYYDDEAIQQAVVDAALAFIQSSVGAQLASVVSALDDAQVIIDQISEEISPNSARLGNQLPAYFLDRENHTGTQAISTISGLQAALDVQSAAIAANAAELDTIKPFNPAEILFELADLKGTLTDMLMMVADSFDDASGLDLPASTLLEWASSIRSEITATPIPNMTGPSAPAGYVASGSFQTTGDEPWRAFDADTAQGWRVDRNPSNTLNIALPAAILLLKYDVKSSASNGGSSHNSKSWRVEGSNDETAWVTVHEVTGHSDHDNVVTYHVYAGTAYRYYRWVVTATEGGSSYQMFGHIKIYENDGAVALDAISQPFAADITPTKASLNVLVEPQDDEPTFVANTHLTGSVSRDDGVTWEDAALTARTFSNGMVILEDTEIDLSGQPSGSTMRWRLTSPSGRADLIQAIVLQWS